MAAAFMGGMFRKVFLAHSFAERDRVLITHIESLLRSHGVLPVTGRKLAGGELTTEVADLITGCDALVAVMTQRADEPTGATSQWVLAELSHARMNRMRAIAIYEAGIPLAPVDIGKEHIEYDSSNPLPAIVRVSETLGEWKRSAGRFLKVLVVPKLVAQKVGAKADRIRAECRFQMHDESETDWMPAAVREQKDGVYVFLRVPEDVDRVQIRLDGPPAVQTPFSHIWPEMEFKRRDG